MDMKNVKIQGHKGTWYSLGSKELYLGEVLVPVHLFEHNHYGEDAPHIIATESGVVVKDELHNGWDDLRYVLEEEIETLEVMIKILETALQDVNEPNSFARIVVPKKIELYRKQIENYKSI